MRFKIAMSSEVRTLWQRQSPILAPLLRVNGQKSACATQITWL